jgi:hypothetical protein
VPALVASSATILQNSGSAFSWSTAPYVEDTPSYHGLVEWNANPATSSGVGTPVSQTLYLMRIVAQTGGAITGVFLVTATGGNSFTAATTATISNVVNNGSGNCRITATAHGFSTNDVITIAGVVGATEANTADVITVIDANTFDLNNTAFTSAYTSGGTATRSPNAAAIYSSAGVFLTASGDQSTVWNTGNATTKSTLAKSITLTVGTVYYVAMLFNGAATIPTFRSLGAAPASNAHLTTPGTSLRWSTNGTTATKLPNSITPSANAFISSTPAFWVAVG